MLLRCLPLLCLVAVLVGSAGVSAGEVDTYAADVRQRIEAILDARRLDRSTLGVIDNLLRHETPPPPFAAPDVRDLLADPVAALDAAALFERSVPASLLALVDSLRAPPATLPAMNGQTDIREILPGFVAELAQAHADLAASLPQNLADNAPLLHALRSGMPEGEQLRELAGHLDLPALQRAQDRFIHALDHFLYRLRNAPGGVRFPEQVLHLYSPIGLIEIGTTGDDLHTADAAVIIDPAGNDRYERTPPSPGRISLIIDLAGNDTYAGSDVAVLALSALIDLAGNDNYAMNGAGLGAAVAGTSILIDVAGDDVYQTENFGQGAAAFGLGALIDVSGNDTYTLRASGQGLGLAGGIGLLWDHAGNDRYTAGGLADPFNRGGGVSLAQGVGYGSRNFIGGGIGLLRDDAGDDHYTAEMFAQGTGYYYGIGLIWDRGGNDRYQAVRYAQGNGVHEAVGLLIEEAGNDIYELTWGVGQGMGLDLGLGLLADQAGDDRYTTVRLGQGAATDNGIGLLIDLAGDNLWQSGGSHFQWGQAESARLLPTLGMLLFDAAHARFEEAGQPRSTQAQDARVGGPFGGMPPTAQRTAEPDCPASVAALPSPQRTTAALLAALSQGLATGTADPPLFAEVRRRLLDDLSAELASLDPRHFETIYSLGMTLRCLVQGATADDAERLWAQVESLFSASPQTPFAGPLLASMARRPPAGERRLRLIGLAADHPRCSVRSLALRLRAATAADADERAQAAALARQSLAASCWREQAQAQAALQQLEAADMLVSPP
jgi:hypothetical protein